MIKSTMSVAIALVLALSAVEAIPHSSMAQAGRTGSDLNPNWKMYV